MLRYSLSFPTPELHYATVTVRVPPSNSSTLEVWLPVWTPGSYLVREYARHLQNFSATDEQSHLLAWKKIRKNCWAIEVSIGLATTIQYQLYCHEISVRTNWVDRDYAFLNAAATFLTSDAYRHQPHRVTMELPPNWGKTVCGLPALEADTYQAKNYDELVDAPILAGNPVLHRFAAGGKPHTLALQGDDRFWDGNVATTALQRIVETQSRFWGGLPYTDYLFLNLITDTGGGLEHQNCCVLMASRWAMRDHKVFLRWLALASHEFFHVWNVKRLRPMELGPFDYHNENHTRNLWIAEGLTEYYGNLLLHRAGITSREEYLEALSKTIHDVQTVPGRLQQDVETASYDAWIKFYRPDENSLNSSISYYAKGAVIGWLLDVEIRKATNDAQSLDDAMRLAYQRFSGERGYTAAEFCGAAEEVAGVSLASWFAQVLRTTAELPYHSALEWLGLQFRNGAQAAKRSSLGFHTKTENGRLLVTSVPHGTAASQAGFDPEDELIAIDNLRVRPEQWAQRLGNYRPGDLVNVLVARREVLLSLPATLQEEPGEEWHLEATPDATPEQASRLARWLCSGDMMR